MNNNKPTSNNVNFQNKNTSTASGGELPQKQMVKTEFKKEQTESFKKIQEYRDRMNYGCLCLMAEDLSSVVYIYENNGKAFARGYKGRAKKATFSYRYKDINDRAQKVTHWMESCSKAFTVKVKEAKERSSTPRALNIDDILRASWGWEQTNIDYYKVTRLVGKNSVEVVEIGSHTDYNGQAMSGTCTPNPDEEIGMRFVRRVLQGDSIKINSSIVPIKHEYQVVDGERKYKPSYYSTYA